MVAVLVDEAQTVGAGGVVLEDVVVVARELSLQLFIILELVG